MDTPADFGPVYTETNFEQWPVEPFNTFSNILFLVVAVYWATKIKKQTNQDFKTFLKVSLPLLLLGFVGGTVYHATRSHLAWMLMDVVPIYVIGVFTGVYHWRLIQYSLFKIIMVFVFLFVVPMTILWTLVPNGPNTPTFGYTILTIPVILPLIIDQIRTHGKYLKAFLLPLLLIAVALGFRALDSTLWVRNNLPIGTHWLWHSFGAATSHFLLVFMEKRSQH